MFDSDTRIGCKRYGRRRLATTLLAVVAFVLAAPAALACSDHPSASFWSEALDALAPANVRAAAQPKASGLKPAKWLTGSRYVQTTARDDLYDQGCTAGRADVTGLVILAFGKPSYDDGRYGTILFSNRFASNEAITIATKAYARGYAACVDSGSDASITLVRGTSNYAPSVPSTYAAGRKWAGETMQLALYLRRHPGVGTRVKAAAGIDAEPAWDRDFEQTHRFFKGYRDARTGYLLYNFGSLDGGVGSIWSLKQAFFVSGGMKYARVVPEIYFPAQAQQWAELARLALKTFDRPVQFAGLMTQRKSGCSRSECGMAPREAHGELGRALMEHPTTADQVELLATVTTISPDE
jgi:hypothetical protein